MVEKRWIIKAPPQKEVIDTLCSEINVSIPTANILGQRGIYNFEGAKAFFRPEKTMLHDPFLMRGMEAAVTRIFNAIQLNEKILIYGDYDVDGTTSVSLVFGYFDTFYHHCKYYIPDRYKEGYGVSKAGMDYAIENDFSLIITLDCGIKAVDLIGYAAGNGIDTIICDHHTPGPVLPPAIAVLDPKQTSCSYPYDELPGCAIGFKLIQAFAQRYPQYSTDPFTYLDLVVVSIASDIVPLTGENRVLAYLGLQQINSKPRPGLKALMRLAGILQKATITGIVFGLAPRINAAGRIAHAHGAVDLLLASTEEEAYHFADKLNLKNTKRREVDSIITEEALSLINENELYIKAKSTVLYNKHWHKGVIGIVASRCIEHHFKPTIILTESNGYATGSARSVPGFNVYDAIEACSDLLEQFGGHKYAAGLTMKIENIDQFRERFDQVVSEYIQPEQLIPSIDIDTELELKHIGKNFFNTLRQMEPFGPENMNPVFMTNNLLVCGQVRVIKEKHLKFSVAQHNDGKQFECIAFGCAELLPSLTGGKPFRMAYTIESNEFRGITSIQLNVKDIKFD